MRLVQVVPLERTVHQAAAGMFSEDIDIQGLVQQFPLVKIVYICMVVRPVEGATVYSNSQWMAAALKDGKAADLIIIFGHKFNDHFASWHGSLPLAKNIRHIRFECLTTIQQDLSITVYLELYEND